MRPHDRRLALNSISHLPIAECLLCVRSEVARSPMLRMEVAGRHQVALQGAHLVSKIAQAVGVGGVIIVELPYDLQASGVNGG